MAATLDITINRIDRSVVLAVQGEVDLYSSPAVRKHIIELTKQKIPSLIIDLTGVSYMDSSGVATLVEGLQLMENYQGHLYLCGLNPMVKEVFELSRLDTVFSITDNLEDITKQIAG